IPVFINMSSGSLSSIEALPYRREFEVVRLRRHSSRCGLTGGHASEGFVTFPAIRTKDLSSYFKLKLNQFDLFKVKFKFNVKYFKTNYNTCLIKQEACHRSRRSPASLRASGGTLSYRTSCRSSPTPRYSLIGLP
ncbi:hypothetical protein L9F63_002779, partial [Diploptera punctata]